MARFYPHPDTGKFIPEEEYRKIQAERIPDKSSEHFGNQTVLLMGNGFPSKRIKTAEKRRRALEKNPYHTTMGDYKFSNPNSIPSKSLKKSKKKLEKAGVDIDKQVTEK